MTAAAGRMRYTRGKLRYFLGGREVSRARYNRAVRASKDAGHPTPRRFGHWPMKSLAMKVHPKKIAAARERDRRNGVPPTEYTPAGEPVWTSERHKREYNRRLGVHDNNAYF